MAIADLIATFIPSTLVLLLLLFVIYKAWIYFFHRREEQPVREVILPQAQVESAEEVRYLVCEGGVDFKKYWAPKELKCFIQDQVIKSLNWQRSDLNKDQFAAVVLSNRDFNELQLETTSDQLVNFDEPSHPDSSNLVNYMVARPDSESNNHAEEELLDRFNELWQNFGQSPPSHILIFSWLMPCTRCTYAIINRLGYLCAHYQVIVVFRSNCPSNSLEVNEENREKLNRAKFKVYQVAYTENLPRQRP